RKKETVKRINYAYASIATRFWNKFFSCISLLSVACNCRNTVGRTTYCDNDCAKRFKKGVLGSVKAIKKEKYSRSKKTIILYRWERYGTVIRTRNYSRYSGNGRRKHVGWDTCPFILGKDWWGPTGTSLSSGKYM